jgi:S-adenosylhomocysteine hydrolase
MSQAEGGRRRIEWRARNAVLRLIGTVRKRKTLKGIRVSACCRSPLKQQFMENSSGRRCGCRFNCLKPLSTQDDVAALWSLTMNFRFLHQR